MKIFKTPIEEKKEFTVDGDTLKFKAYNKNTGIYIYERFHNGGKVAYEVIKPTRCKQPDGTPLKCYPSTAQFGTYGRYFPSNSYEKAKCYFENPDWATLDETMPWK